MGRNDPHDSARRTHRSAATLQTMQAVVFRSQTRVRILLEEVSPGLLSLKARKEGTPSESGQQALQRASVALQSLLSERPLTKTGNEALESERQKEKTWPLEKNGTDSIVAKAEFSPSDTKTVRGDGVRSTQGKPI